MLLQLIVDLLFSTPQPEGPQLLSLALKIRVIAEMPKVESNEQIQCLTKGCYSPPLLPVGVDARRPDLPQRSRPHLPLPPSLPAAPGGQAICTAAAASPSNTGQASLQN